MTAHGLAGQGKRKAPSKATKLDANQDIQKSNQNAFIDTPALKKLQIPSPHKDCTIYKADNLQVLEMLPDESMDLIYIDPPFNTGIKREYQRIRTIKDEQGGRVGYNGNRYRSEKVSNLSYADSFDSPESFLSFIKQRLQLAYKLLKPTGSLFFHLDYREIHYCKIMLDGIFGRDSFINEIIWSYDYGGKPKNRWPAKHDNILWYAKNPGNYTFNYDNIDRVPYMAPGLVGKEKAALGKVPTDVWWNTIVPTNSKERTGYPTQKPLAILERIVKVHSNPKDMVLDFFAGSGTTGIAAIKNDRRTILVDNNPAAINIIKKQLTEYKERTSQATKIKKIGTETDLNFFCILSSGAFGARVRRAILDFLSEHGFKVSKKTKRASYETINNKKVVKKAGRKPYHALINDKKIVIKVSSIWKGGTNYVFQQIKEGDWDYLLCVGISSAEDHLWIMSRKDIDKISGQHTGTQAKETKWIHISPEEMKPDYLEGGTLEEGLNAINATLPKK